MIDRTVIQDPSAARYHVGALDFTGAVSPLCKARVSPELCIVRREKEARKDADMCPACAQLVNGAH